MKIFIILKTLKISIGSTTYLLVCPNPSVLCQYSWSKRCKQLQYNKLVVKLFFSGFSVTLLWSKWSLGNADSNKLTYIVEFNMSIDNSAALTLTYSFYCYLFVWIWRHSTWRDIPGSALECYLHFMNAIPGVVNYYELLLWCKGDPTTPQHMQMTGFNM